MTQILCKRFSDHNIDYKAYLKGKGNFITSFKILELGYAYIELLEEINCDNRNQLEKREGELIREHKNNCVNKYIAGKTKKEYKIDNIESIKAINKQYKIDNKESILKQNKQYRIDNIEIITKNNKQYYNDNKESISIQSKQYYKDNKDKILEKKKQYNNDNKESAKAKATLPYLCACGLTLRTDNKAKHNKTAKHIEALEQEIIII